MSSLTKLFFSTAFVQLASKGLNLILAFALARLLGPEQYGLYGLTMSIIVVAVLPAIAGLPNLLIREISIYRQEKRWAALRGISSWSKSYVIISSLIMAIIVLIYSKISSDPLLAGTLSIASLIVIIRAYVVRNSAILAAFEKPVWSQFIQYLVNPLFTLVILMLFYVSAVEVDTVDVIKVTLGSWLLLLLISTLICNKTTANTYSESSREYDKGVWRKAILPFSLMTIIGTVNVELASIYIGFTLSHESVAIFKVAMQCVAVVAVGLSAINVVIMPNLSQLYSQGDVASVQDLLSRSVRLNFIFCLIAIVVCVVWGKALITLVFGDDYIDSYAILIILCVGQFFNVAMGSVGAVMAMTKNERSAIPLLSISLLINFFSLSVLTPIFAVEGAAVSTALSVVVLNIMMALKVKKSTGLKTWFKF